MFESTSETSDSDLAQQRPENGQVEQAFIEVVTPARVLAHLLDAEVQPKPPTNTSHQKVCTNWLNPMTIRVGRGNATPSPANRLAKMGTTHLSSAPTINAAMPTTATDRSTPT